MPKNKYTQAEWARIQARLPEEDRVPYSESPKVATLEELEARVQELPKPKPQDPYYLINPATGLSPAQEEANKLINQAMESRLSVGLEGVITEAPGSAARINTPPNEPLKKGYEWATRSGAGGGVIWYQRPISGYSFASGSPVVTTSSPIVTPSSTGDNSALLALIQSLQNQVTQLTQNKVNQAALEEAAKKEKAENAISVLTARFSQYNLQSLVPKIRELAIGGATEATITLQLQESEEYKMRFRANQDRIKKGLAVLDPGDYINLEDKYRQILRAYGLRQFDNDDYVQQFIANDISSAELSSRVQLAVQRVQNADPAVFNALNKYYGIGTTDLVAYALDPDTQFQKIERQVAAAEIGAAAALQGIQPGVAVAEQLAAQGVTQAEARKGYATIADILPGATKLSQIYGNVMEGYGLAEAEQEVFNSLASAQRKRRGLLEREVAAFAGASGLGKTSLTTAIGGTY